MKTNKHTQCQQATGGSSCLSAANSLRTTIGRWSVILLVVAGMQTLLTPRLQAAPTKKEITDNGITSAVKTELKRDKGVAPDDLDVSTGQGIVTLSGSMDNVFAKARAVKIAENMRGVRGVIDRITVTPVSRPDKDIRKDILMALMQDPATDSYQVAVSVQDAVVTLTGSVGSYAETRLAARIAEGVKGAKEVRNNVTINYLAKRTDSQIANDIKARLQWDIWINGELINAVVNEGKVTLTGTIGTAISKSRAFDDAWVNGVTSVDDSNVKIEPRTNNVPHKEHEFALRSDGEIKEAVQAALRLDPRVSAFAPDVTVEDGGVILGGNVGNLKAKMSAEQDAKNIVGVWRVDNLLNVRLKERSTDADTAKQLKAALAWDPMLESTAINVVVGNRVATLSGTVDSSFQQAEAEDVASRTKGVLSVRNRLKVETEYSYVYGYSPDYSDSNWPYPSGFGYPYYNRSLYYNSGTYEPQLYRSDDLIKKSIEDEFFWSPFVDSDDIKVSVHDGVATLTGTVGTRIGLGEAGRDAYEGGATNVVNQVNIKHNAWWWWW